MARRTKTGPAPVPKRELDARGSWRAREKPEEAKPPRRIGRRPRELTEAEILGGIPGYDPGLHAGDRFVYDHERALKAIRFFHDRLTLVTGARPGTRFALQPWQQSLIGNLFGWVDRSTGRRRYRYAFLYVAKKNGKSALAAGIMLYVLAREAEDGIRLFSLAASRDQTNVLFEPAAQMIRNDRELRRLFVVYGNSAGATNKSIVSVANALSTFRGLPHDADTSDGVNPHFLFADEIHRYRSGELLELMLKGMVSRALKGEPCALLTTTADSNRPGACNEWLKRARSVRDNRGRTDEPGFEPRLLPVIYEAGPKDDWTSPATWLKANPSLGVTVSEEALAEEVRAIRQEPSRLNDFLRLHCNIVTDTKEAALPLCEWDACPSEPPSDAALAKAQAFGGLDISAYIDLTSLCLWWPSLGYARWWFWIPRRGMLAAEDRDRVPYSTWARQGLVDVVDGEAIDHGWIQERVYSICAAGGYAVKDLGYDPWNCDDIGMWLASRGVATVRTRQGHQTLGAASKALEAAVVSHRLNHGGNPVARWNAGNLAWRRDANGNICPDKGERPNLRIDGMVALVIAMSRAIGQPAPRKSAYAERGVRFV